MDEQKKRVVEIGTVSTEEILEEVLGGQDKETSIENDKTASGEQELSSETVKECETECEMEQTNTATEEKNSDDPKGIYELLEEDIMASDIPDAEKTIYLIWKGSKFTVTITVRLASQPIKYAPIAELQGQGHLWRMMILIPAAVSARCSEALTCSRTGRYPARKLFFAHRMQLS